MNFNAWRRYRNKPKSSRELSNFKRSIDGSQLSETFSLESQHKTNYFRKIIKEFCWENLRKVRRIIMGIRQMRWSSSQIKIEVLVHAYIQIFLIMKRCNRLNILLRSEKAKDSMFGALGETVKRVDPISFYHLKSELARKLLWHIQQAKRKKGLESGKY